MQPCVGTPWLKMSGGGQIEGCLRQPKPQTSTSVLDGHQSSISYRRQRPPGLAWPGLASPRLASLRFTSPHRCRASNTSLGSPSSDHTSAHARRTRGVHLPRSGSRSGICLLCRPNARSALFLPVRPPSFGEEDGRGRGKGWEVDERARRQSVVVSWLRAAVAE